MSASAPPRPPMDARIRQRRREVSRAAVRRRQRIVASVAAVLAIAAAAFGLSHSPLFAVDEVRIEGIAGERAEQVHSIAAVTPGERLFSVDLDGVTDAVEALAWVRDVDVSRVPPSTVAISVTPREPVAVVQLETSAWLIDAEGVVVAGGVDEGLPLIDAPTSVLPGPGVEASDAAVRNALDVHRGLPGPLRTAVARYDAPSARGLRVLLAWPVHDGEPGAGGASDHMEGSGDAAGEAPADAGEDEASSDVGGVWVRFGLAERVEEKAQVIGLLLEQAREQAALGDRSDLGIAELDVRAPDNPVLIPRS